MSQRGPIRILVVDDSRVCQEILSALLEADPDISVIGSACSGPEAIARTVELRPDVISMDVSMSGEMDGIEATAEIMKISPCRVVIVSALVREGDAELSMRALQSGALAVVKKPRELGSEEFMQDKRHLLGTIKAVAGVQLRRRGTASVRPDAGSDRPSPRTDLGSLVGRRYDIVAIAASVGGPEALQKIFSELSPDFPRPVVLVQHMSPGFIGGFVSWLDSVSPLRVKLATHGERLRQGVVHVAPSDRHLYLSSRGTAGLSDDPPVGVYKPAASYLFQSVAEIYRRSVLALVLTGMGRDGLSGLRAVRAAGGGIIAQDEASSVVFGMPRAAIEAGLSHSVLGLDDIGAALIKLTKNP